MKATHSAYFAAVLIGALSSSAAALAVGTQPRAWVSGLGADAVGCGSLLAPCRSFQYAHDKIVFAGGTIDVKDAAAYGPIIIRNAISIVNDGSGTAVILAAAGGIGVDVSAGAADAIHIKGLVIDGVGAGNTGVLGRSFGQLTIEDCTIKGFPINGGGAIRLIPSGGTSHFAISHVLLADSYFGVLAQANGGAVITGQVSETAIANTDSGVWADAQSGTSSVAVSNTQIENPHGVGLFATNVNATISADTVEIDHAEFAVDALNGGAIYLSNVTVANSTNVDVFTFGGGIVFTYGNNIISAAAGALTPIALH